MCVGIGIDIVAHPFVLARCRQGKGGRYIKEEPTTEIGEDVEKSTRLVFLCGECSFPLSRTSRSAATDHGMGERVGAKGNVGNRIAR